MSGETQCEIVYSVASISWFLTVINHPYATVLQVEEAVRGIRYLLDVDQDRTVQLVLQAGLLPQLIKFLYTYGHPVPKLILENWRCAFQATVEAGEIPLLIQRLQHGLLEVRYEAALYIANIAEISTEYRDRLLTSGALEPLLLNIRLPEYEGLLCRNATEAVFYLCHGEPVPAFELVEPAIPVLCELLKVNSVSTDAKFYAAMALYYLSVGESRERGRIAIMRTGALPVLVSFLDDKSSHQRLLPALLCLNNLVDGSNDRIQKVMDADGFLNHLVRLLESECEVICEDSCLRILSNICAGTEAQIGKILSKKELIRSLGSHAFNSVLEIREEAIWAISNIFIKGNSLQVLLLIQDIGLRPLVDVLHANIADQIGVKALEAIDCALSVYARTYMDHSLLDERALETIQSLQEHPNDYINQKARRILQTYFGAKAEVNENMAPTTTNSCSF